MFFFSRVFTLAHQPNLATSELQGLNGSRACLGGHRRVSGYREEWRYVVPTGLRLGPHFRSHRRVRIYKTKMTGYISLARSKVFRLL